MSRLTLLLVVLLVSFVLLPDFAAAAKKRSKGGDASRYADCDSCVAAGYGWSWEEEECGTYVNTDCSSPGHAGQQEEHSSSTYDSSISTDEDKDDDDDFPSPPSHSRHSSHRSASDSDDDEILADDEDEYGRATKTFSWADTDATTHIWHMIHRGDYEGLSRLLEQDEDVVRYRSRDGRGALWWAYEFGHDDMVDLLVAHGADQEEKDAGGKRPLEMRQIHADL
jgi:hypothetical protein